MGRQKMPRMATIVDLKSWVAARREKVFVAAWYSDGNALKIEPWELKRIHKASDMTECCVKRHDFAFHSRAERLASMVLKLTKSKLVDYEPGYWEAMLVLVQCKKLRGYAGKAVLRSSLNAQNEALRYFLETERCSYTGYYGSDLASILDPLDARIARYDVGIDLDSINRCQAARIMRDFICDILAHLYTLHVKPFLETAE